MARKALPNGVEYIGGSARQYRVTNADGSQVLMSRRSYMKVFEHTSPERIRAAKVEAGTAQPMTRYNAIVRDYIRTHEALTGQRLSKRAARTSPELKGIIKDLHSKSNAPTGKKAGALIMLGRRNPEWQNIVGESPR